MEFGLKGERLAKTPTRLLPPSLGGRTVGEAGGREAADRYCGACADGGAVCVDLQAGAWP